MRDEVTPARGVRLGRVLGTPVVLMPSWFAVAGIVTFLYAPQVQTRLPNLGAGAFLVALVSALLLLLSVFLHELAHAIAARAVGTAPTHIALDLWGGHTAFADEFSSPGRSALVSLVGPVTNAALALIGWAAARAVPDDGVGGLLLIAFVYTNAFVAVFNALPGLPLDGGRVLEALVWRVTGSPTAGSLAAGWCGRLVAVAVVVWALLVPLVRGRTPSLTSTVWLLLVAGLLWQGASGAVKVARWRRRAPEVTVRGLLRPAVGLPSFAPLATALAAARAGHGSDVVLLDEAGRPTAVLDTAAAQAVPPERGAVVEAASVARALAGEATLGLDLAGEGLIARMQAAPHAEYAVLDPQGAVVGLLAWDAVAADLAGR